MQKVTLIPRGQARGLTWFIPGEDPSLISKQQIFARVVGALGGRAAEEIIFGEAEVTTGASSDLQQVTSMAKQVNTFLTHVVCFNLQKIGYERKMFDLKFKTAEFVGYLPECPPSLQKIPRIVQNIYHIFQRLPI